MRVSPLFLLVAAGGLLSLAPASAAEPAQPAQAKAPDESSKVICRKEAETGSILKKRRVCYTKRQWDQAAQRSREAMTQGQMSGGASGQ